MLKKIISSIFSIINLSIIKKDKLIKIDNERKYYRHELHKLKFLFSNPRINEPKKISKIAKESFSQIFQDLFVINETNYKKNGYFIEIGAADGMYFSNTYLLESKFSWNGLVVEPVQTWHEDLYKNRSCIISTDCLHSTSEVEVEFNETVKPAFSFINIKNPKGLDNSKNMKQKVKDSYILKTISMNDLFEKYDIPNQVDYLSIDVEGAEYDILKTFNFEQYKISIITIEHGFTKNREKIFELLTSKGYSRVQEDFSQFDDWYVLN
tara:strand:+ start:1316 stop:2113 length:798 start_codon:yes stop_codon:yes gene_type:complete